jgi:hypothetical protein
LEAPSAFTRPISWGRWMVQIAKKAPITTAAIRISEYWIMLTELPA